MIATTTPEFVIATSTAFQFSMIVLVFAIMFLAAFYFLPKK